MESYCVWTGLFHKYVRDMRSHDYHVIHSIGNSNWRGRQHVEDI